MWEKILNALMIFVIAMVLLGALSIQFFGGAAPCPLCLLQRLGMLAVASAALLNVVFVPRKLHYGLIIIAAFFGGFVALRHIALNTCPSSPPFGEPVWGLSLYMWSFFVFVCSTLAVAFFLIVFDKNIISRRTASLKGWVWVPSGLLFLVAMLNTFAAYWQYGLKA